MGLLTRLFGPGQVAGYDLCIFCQRGVYDFAETQPKRLSCTAGSLPVDHGEDFFRTFAPAGVSTR